MDDNNAYKILIVDDEENIRGMYVEVFRKEGFEVVEAVDGLAGLEKAMQEKPDVIFTGIIMPRMDGFGLVEELDKNVATSSIPVVMSSHMGRKEDHERAKLIGVKDFIVQGMVTPKAVVDRIRAILKLSGYNIKIKTRELDAFRLSADLNLSEAYICENCQEEMVLHLDIVDLSTKELRAKFVCPKCK